MKKIIPFIMLLLISSTMQAQLFKSKYTQPSEEYSAGAVPVVNNKVTFEETILAEGLSGKEIENIAREWVKERFVKPTVISFKEYDDEIDGTVVGKSEEYIVFKKRFFVLNRSRIYYYITLTCNDGSCTFNMSRITYWWDDEAEDGGFKLKAEDCITDAAALDKKGRMERFNGKFRTKTIDLKNLLVEELTKKLSKR